jgi:hypothetical protein
MEAIRQIPGAKFVLTGALLAIVMTLLFTVLAFTQKSVPYLPKTAAEKAAYPICETKAANGKTVYENLSAQPPVTPKNKAGKEIKGNKADPKNGDPCPLDTAMNVNGPGLLARLLLPIVVVIPILLSVRSPKRRRYWLIGSVALLLVGTYSTGLPIIFAAGLCGWGTWQTSKWERTLMLEDEEG